jgi:hypothetical protein
MNLIYNAGRRGDDDGNAGGGSIVGDKGQLMVVDLVRVVVAFWYAKNMARYEITFLCLLSSQNILSLKPTIPLPAAS